MLPIVLLVVASSVSLVTFSIPSGTPSIMSFTVASIVVNVDSYTFAFFLFELFVIDVTYLYLSLLSKYFSIDLFTKIPENKPNIIGKKINSIIIIVNILVAFCPSFAF